MGSAPLQHCVRAELHPWDGVCTRTVVPLGVRQGMAARGEVSHTPEKGLGVPSAEPTTARGSHVPFPARGGCCAREAMMKDKEGKKVGLTPTCAHLSP